MPLLDQLGENFNSSKWCGDCPAEAIDQLQLQRLTHPFPFHLPLAP